MRSRRLSILALALAAFLFGATFVVIKAALASTPPLAFVGWRFAIGALVLSLIAPPRHASLWRDGTIAGLFLFAGYALQTAGLSLTGAGNSALITGLYVVITPLLAGLFYRRRPSGVVVGGAIVAFAGMALLTISNGIALQAGDLLTLGCAVAFAGNIVALSRLAPRHPVIPFTAVQLLVTAGLGLAGSALVEGWSVPPTDTWAAILVTGIGVSAGAFLLQVWAQTVLDSATTALVLALEPVFGVATAMVVLGERLTTRGIAGAVLMVGAIFAVVSRPAPGPMLDAEAVTPAH